VPIDGVRPATDYAVVVTTPAGLVRYVTGDIVQFTSLAPARLVYVGRTALRLNTFGEQVDERDITEAFSSVCRRNGWTIVNFHVAPLRAEPLARSRKGRHEWWVELQAGTQLTPTGPVIAPEVDAALIKSCPTYAARRSDGTMEAPYVRLVMPGVFEQWMRYHGKWGGNNKMPRCRDDRSIADELGGALQFAKD
jgi:GH3 auxin-responsive promoter